MAQTGPPDPDVLYTSSTEKTFQYQDELPSLPVPSLQHTLDRYLDSVKPHVTEEEFRQTEFIAQQFASGIGKDLHKKLLERAATHRNWLHQWWQDYAYMDFRQPVAPLVNFSGPGPYMDHFLSPQEGNQIYVAALVIHFSTKFWSLVRKERLRPDKDSKGTKLCMDQFRYGFSTCRIPAVKRDHMKFYFKTESEGDSPTNLVVFCRGRIFTMKAVDDNGDPLTPPELQQQFQYIRDTCDKGPMGPAVGAFTGDNRTTWAKMRSRLIALHPTNYANLVEIQKSILCVALEDTSPKDTTELFMEGLAGDPTNRWFDKSLTLAFYKNGLAASNCDHSPYDAMVLVSSTYYVDLNVMKCKGQWQGSQEVRPQEPPRELVFILDEPLYKGIDNAKQVYNKFARNLQLCATDFTDYGKKYLRKNKLHPDTHVQLALQYAYYKMHNKPAPTYETATTRKYYHARTETMRSCTTEAIEWCKSMLDPNSSVQEKYHLYRRAMDRHNFLMAEAQNNAGCDRHLLGLQILAIEGGLPMPQLYTDPSYAKSGGGGNFVLSTSFTGYTTVYGGVVPMVEHGYGSFYRIESDRIGLFVSSWASCDQTNATKFNHTVQESFREMAKVIDAGTAKAARL